MPQYTLTEIAKLLNGEVHGDVNCQIIGVAPILEAATNEITFITDPRYRKYLAQTNAAAVVLNKEDFKAQTSDDKLNNSIIVANPKLSVVKLISLFFAEPKPAEGIHPTAIIGNDCQIDSGVIIGAYCVIEDGVSIGANSIIHPGTIIGKGVSIGTDCCLYSRVSIYHSVQIGDRVIIHSGAVIGSDGFGLAMEAGSKEAGSREVSPKEADPKEAGPGAVCHWVKVPHVGTVVIGNDVEIGANTAIDRGMLEKTMIGNGVKIDNLVQVGHNVKIGDHTVISGCTGIAGSAEIGSHCMIGGGACIADHVVIGDHVIIGGMGAVPRSVMEPGIYSSVMAVSKHEKWRRNMLRFQELDQMAKRLKKLEMERQTHE